MGDFHGTFMVRNTVILQNTNLLGKVGFRIIFGDSIRWKSSTGNRRSLLSCSMSFLSCPFLSFGSPFLSFPFLPPPPPQEDVRRLHISDSMHMQHGRSMYSMYPQGWFQFCSLIGAQISNRLISIMQQL